MEEKIDLVKFQKERTLIKDVFLGDKETIEIAGWVDNTRDLSKVKFIILKDISGVIQITGINGETSENLFEMMVY